MSIDDITSVRLNSALSGTHNHNEAESHSFNSTGEHRRTMFIDEGAAHLPNEIELLDMRYNHHHQPRHTAAKGEIDFYDSKLVASPLSSYSIVHGGPRSRSHGLAPPGKDEVVVRGQRRATSHEETVSDYSSQERRSAERHVVNAALLKQTQESGKQQTNMNYLKYSAFAQLSNHTEMIESSSG